MMKGISWKRLRNRPSKTRSIAYRATKRCLVEKLENRWLFSVSGFRPIDEIGNNVANPNFGVAGIHLVRKSDAAYPDGTSTPSLLGGAPFFIAGPRLVSNIVSNQDDPNSVIPNQDFNTVNQNGLSNFGYTFGQFLDHDMDLTPDQTGLPIPTPNNRDGNNGFKIPAVPAEFQPDPIGSLAFSRSVFDTNTGTTNPREQINVNTAYLDLSQVYGSTVDVASALRTHSKGLLKTSPGNMLPYNNTIYFTQAELTALNMANDSHLLDSTVLFAAGDVRANETIELTALQTLFMRNHNALATQLGRMHPKWNDEQIYQEARKLNIAEYQAIVYEAYLPALLGPTAIPVYAGYKSNVDPSISTEFSTVGFRFGHSLLNNTVPRLANNGTSLGDVNLADSFFNPNLVNPLGTIDSFTHLASTDIGPILKGDANHNAQAMDVYAVSAIRNHLFAEAGPGEDLISRDMWRADDHGIGTYNHLRQAYGLPTITDFSQITSDTHVQDLLKQAFTGLTREAFGAAGKNAGDIHSFIAGLAEDHVPGSNMGPLFTAILADQFSRLRDGDRFFYLNQNFTPEERAFIRQGDTLSEIIRSNTTAKNLPADVFHHFVRENGEDAKFFTGKDGQLALTGSKNGTTLSASLLAALTQALDPNHTGQLPLVDKNGNHLATSDLQSFSTVQDFLRKVNPKNIANVLSVQLLTTELNVALNKVDPNTSVFLPVIDDMSLTQEKSLITRGVSNPSGIVKIADLLTATITELSGQTLSNNVFDQALKTSLEAINDNELIFIPT